jgi:hypothetical protein
MDLQSSFTLTNVHQGVQYKEDTHVNKLNSRLSDRQFGDSPLEPNFDMRPVPTKYSVFPIINRRKPVHEEKLEYINYNQSVNFSPVMSNGPVSGYMSNVDTETILRNQPFALQRGIGQDVYVPSSNSDLYKVTVVSRPSEQPHLGLFEPTVFSNRPHPNVEHSTIGKEQFFNHTRTQLRNSVQ